MKVSARRAVASDLDRILELYGPAEQEQVDLCEAWAVADGLAEPRLDTLQSLLDSESSLIVVGCIDDFVLGFGLAIVEDLLPQAGGEQVGVIHIIYVEEPARMVGIAEAMLAAMMTWFDDHGLTRYDAVVSPGHRLAKNFFESAGFKARRITMYRRDQ